MFRKKITFIILFLTLFINVKSQIDTSFWFVAPDISQGLGDRPIYLYFNTYAQASTVLVRQPANGGFVPITKVIPANSIDSINLTSFIANIENNTANTILNNGLYISATQKISALYSIRSAANKEYFSLKGPKALGVDFYVPMQEFWNQAPATSPKSFSSFDIIASENNTTVLITPRTSIIGRAANVSFSILLQKGQTFSCQDTTRSATTSLAGSIVSSNKPIAVTIQSSGLNELGCLSSVGDQITSSVYLGNDYIVNRGTASSEKIFVLATQNNTQLTINDGSVTNVVMNFGQNYTYNATQPVTYVKTNKPVYTLHVSGYGCRLSGAQLPPFFCAGTFTTAFTRTSSDSLALNLITRTGYEGNFALNGNGALIPASAFTVVPGSSGAIKSARIYYNTATIPVGSHNEVTNSGDVFGMSALNGSYNKGSAYAYLSEFVSYPSINAGSDFTVCANGSVAINGQIGGGNITGIWSTTGYGTFNAGFSALTNTYTPSQLDTTVKPVKLILTTNGQCPQQKDTMFISVKPSPLVNASVDQVVCGNNNLVTLNGSIGGATSTGFWASPGTGTFTPNNTTLNSTYLPSAAETSAGSVKLVLTSTGNGICALVTDTMKVTITPIPTSNIAATSVSVCANNPTLSVTGTIGGIATTGKWTTSGTGSFNPSNILLTTNYTPSAADILSGQVKLYLSSTNNGTCNQAKDSLTVFFTTPPVVNAGTNFSVCKNNALSALSATITGPTSTGIWSGGTGTFSPNNTTLNANYTPSAAELAAGFVNLTLTSTGNGNCSSVLDNVLINFTSPPTVNAGVNLSACKNNASVVLSGIISGTTTTGIWTGGLGTFSPLNTALNGTYTPTPAELAAGSVTLTLTSTANGNCLQVIDNMIINYTASPVVLTTGTLTTCKNNAFALLSGTISGGSTTGVWTGGSGGFNPSNSVLNATYTPSAGELTAGFTNLTLTSSNNGNCIQVTNTLQIIYTNAPITNAGVNLSTCKNNPLTVLSGTVSGPTTTGIWSGGSGSFTPNNTTLNASYNPSPGEIAAGFVNLTLTSTANGNCNSVSDIVLLNFTNAPSVFAGSDLFSCSNNPNAALSGIVSGPTSTGIWSGGTGTFTPSNTSLNPTYVPSAADILAGVVSITLTSTSNGNCLQVTDSLKINYTPSPIVNAGLDITSCKNNSAAVLSGTVSGGTTTGIWSGGTGFYNPSNSVLNSIYTPSAAELTAGFTKLILSSSNNGTCLQVKDTVMIVYSNSPITNAGLNITSCKNNPFAVLSGTVSGPTTSGIWSGGAGTYLPNNTVLTATYTPSAAEITAGFVNLTLTSTANGNCNAVSDLVLINFSNAPSVTAGTNLFSCKNNASATLSGIVSGPTTTGIWAGGTGTFTPSNTSLNATYIPSASDLIAGIVTLTLSSTNNGSCLQEIDTVKINYTNSPVVNAGLDIISCKNNAPSVLTGTVSGATTTGIWTGGTGNYNPSNSVLNSTYSPSGAELTAGFVKLVLTSSNNGNCLQVTDTVMIVYSNSPITNAGINFSACKNNASSLLTGTVTGPTTTGIWTGGNGTYFPNNASLTMTYTPTPAEITAGFVNLILTSSNNGNCTPVSDNVLINFTTPPSVYAGIDLFTCINNPSSILSGSINGPTTTGIWAGGSGTFTPSNTSLNPTYIPTPAEISNGNVTITLISTNNGNCSQVKDSLVINYTSSPNINAGTDLFSCKNNAATTLNGLISGATTTGIWTGGAGGFNPSNTSLTTTYTPTAAEVASGSVTLTLNSTNNGNCNQANDTIVINFTNSPTVFAGLDLISCKNNASTTLSGLVSGPTTTGVWAGGSGTFNPNNSSLTATYVPTPAEIAVGFVNLVLTSTNNLGCNAVTDIIKLNFVPKPFANFNFNNVCLNNSTTFTDFSLPGSGTLTAWQWSFGDGTTSITQNTTHTYSSSTTFTAQLVVTNSNGCNDTIKQTPVIYPLPSVNFGINRICTGSSLTVLLSDSTTVPAPGSVTQWFWDFGGPGQSNVQNPSQLYPGSGFYSIKLIATTNYGCKDTVVKQLNLTPRPSAGFAYSVSSGVNVGTTVNFVDTSSYASNWNWSFGDAQGSVSSLQNPSTIYYDNGTYVITQIVSDGYGCSDTARVAIKINNITYEISTLIPNAISPNGDGKNDVWKLDFLSLLYPNASVQIFNRWGENIYSAEGNYSNPWDGTYKGQLLPVGTYYYILNLNDQKNTEPFKGGILLIR